MLDRAALAVALVLTREPKPRGAAGAIAAAGQAFSASIRAAAGYRHRRPTQHEKVLELQRAYIAGEITETSLELELAHLPGGIPE